MTDRELDALVAEKVMGAVSRPDIKFSDGPYFQFSDNLTRTSPHYSTDISAAWKVVEKMTGPDMKPSLGNNQGKGWRVTFVEYYKTEDRGERCRFHDAIADTAPKAICLAALKAVGHEANNE